VKLPAYPKYKPSGIEWIGDVPEHWEKKRLKFVCRLAYGDSLTSETREEGNVPVFGSNGQVGLHNTANTKAPCIIVGRKGSFGKVNYCETNAFAIDTTYFIDSNQTKEDLRWLYYVLGWLKLDSFSKDSAVPGLAREDVYYRWIPFPHKKEQQAIADYLDRETGRIDELIAKKREFIDKLKEKRTALISQAVTKGLDPKVKLKPSGIKWLDDVPKHWQVKRLKYVTSINDEALSETTPSDYEILYVDIGGVDPFEGITKKELMTFDSAPSRARRVVRDGDTIVSTVRTYLRAIAPVEKAEDNLIVSTGFAVIRPRNINSNYLSYALRCPYFVETVVSNSVGVSYPAINASELATIEIPLPSSSEQQAIASYLDKEIGKIDNLIEKVEKAIKKLQEYRSAIISAAVTGKIKV